MELTLRTNAAVEALKLIKQHVPQMIAGVGTILTKEQVAEVKQAGAAFGVAPGTNPVIIEEARKQDLPFAPGVVTPTDIDKAVELGCRLLKFFPAEVSGGLEYLNCIAAPYKHLDLRYIPLGGVNEKNMRAYLQDPLIAAVGGSWLGPKELIKEKNWPQITQTAKRARKIIQEIRP
jgi:2-dehydro-3-deoxyphosphogluconate aldolase/(4S)-4-hydroxy-2-oxoglutarate aldolase